MSCETVRQRLIDHYYGGITARVSNEISINELARGWRLVREVLRFFLTGDGIAYRTLPGVHPNGAYFVRGSGHNRFGGYTEDSDEYREVLDRLLVKWETAKKLVPEPVIRRARRGAKWGILSIGSSDAAVTEAIARLARHGERRFPSGLFARKRPVAHAVDNPAEPPAQLRAGPE